MSVPSPISSGHAGRPIDDPTLSGWYLEKPATLRVSEPFLVVTADNAEVVFPRREFRFEIIGPSPTRPGTQQLMFIGEAVNVVFETPFDGGWERFIEAVPPELVVTPEAAQLEAVGMQPPSPIGLRIGELDIEPASPPPPTGPMLAHADGSPVVGEVVPIPPVVSTEPASRLDEPGLDVSSLDVSSLDGSGVPAPRIDVPRIVLATQLEAETDDESELGLDADMELIEDADSMEVPDFVASIARRDLELSDLDLEVEVDEEVQLFDGAIGFDELIELDDRDPAELDGLIESVSETDGDGPARRDGNRFLGEGADQRWGHDIAPTVRAVTSTALPVLRVAAPVFVVSRAVVRLREGATVLDRLLDLVLAISVATLVVVALGALLALVRPLDVNRLSLAAPLEERLARSARRVGVAAFVVAALVAVTAALGPWIERGVTWAQVGWTVVAIAAAMGLSAACTQRAKTLLDDTKMEEAR